MSKLNKLIKKYHNGHSGKGKLFSSPIIPSSVNEFACIRGIYKQCKNPIDCKHLYGDRSEINCTNKSKKGKVPFILTLEEIYGDYSRRYLSIQDVIVREYYSSKN